MLLIQANCIKKSFGVKTVLDFDAFQVYEGDKIGIVGANGAGKTTLMGILYGEVAPDEGTVTRTCEAAYIRQFADRDTRRSGGENAKSEILRQTLAGDVILFADEPTANLDADGQKWILSLLTQMRTVLLVSHDRALLDSVCNKIVEIKDGALTFYTGNYSDYESAVELTKAQRQEDFAAYQRKKAQLETAAQSKDRKVAHMRQQKRRDYAKNGSEARLGGHKRAASIKHQEKQAKVLQARIDRLPKVEKLRNPPKLHIDFSLTNPPGNKHVINCAGLDFSYGQHRVFEDAAFVIPNGKKTALTGSNGSGKSTLLRLIREGHGSIALAPKLRPGFLYQSFENLDPDATVLDNAMSSSIQDNATVRSVLAGLLFFGDDVYKQTAALSGGEKMRLSLAKLLTGAYNALLLDEPTNYLDLPSVQAVQKMIQEYPGTVLLICHDSRFVEAVADMRLHIRDRKLVPMPLDTEAAPASPPADKTLLQIRLTRLVSEIGAAPPERKTLLEQQYHQVLAELRELE